MTQCQVELLDEEGLDAHTVVEVWVMSANDRADHYVDITDTFHRKIAALRAHASQTAHMTGLEERLRAWGPAKLRPGVWRRVGWPNTSGHALAAQPGHHGLVVSGGS